MSNTIIKEKRVYSVIATGVDTAGLITTSAISDIDGQIALIERTKMGDDCLNFGHISSKSLIASTCSVENVNRAEVFGMIGTDLLWNSVRVPQHKNPISAPA